MQAIGSSDGWYLVRVRGVEKPLAMSLDGGKALSDYLEGEPSAFVHIKDLAGAEYTIRTMTIDRVEKYSPDKNRYKTPKELGMPDL